MSTQQHEAEILEALDGLADLNDGQRPLLELDDGRIHVWFDHTEIESQFPDEYPPDRLPAWTASVALNSVDWTPELRWGHTPSDPDIEVPGVDDVLEPETDAICARLAKVLERVSTCGSGRSPCGS